MKQHYQAILLGASMKALGYAHTHPGCLILERSEFLAPEYTLSLRPVLAKVIPDGSEMANFLTERQLISQDGIFRALPLLPALCEYVLAERMEVQLLTETVSAERSGDGWVVTCYNTDGLQEIHAEKVLDTRLAAEPEKFFHVVCHDLPPQAEKVLQTALPQGIGMEFWDNGAETYLSFRFPASYTHTQARKLVFRSWQKAFPEGEAQMTFQAFEFDVCPSERLEASPLRDFHAGEQM